MNFVILLFAVLIGQSAHSSEPPAPASKPANLFYFENVPNNSQKITFKINKRCEPGRSPIRLEKFQSKQELKSPETGKMEPVRVIHVYASAQPEGCSSVLSEPSEASLEIPKWNSFTHVYVTTSPELTVKSYQ